MIIVSFFTDGGVPKTGLSPTMDIWDIDGTQVVTSGSMTEVGGGFYKYDFSSYDETKDYCIRADGGSSLSNSERYAYSTNEADTTTISNNVDNILKINKNKMVINNNQLIIYDDDGTTELYKFDLKDNSGNPTESNVYERDPA